MRNKVFHFEAMEQNAFLMFHH